MTSYRSTFYRLVVETQSKGETISKLCAEEFGLSGQLTRRRRKQVFVKILTLLLCLGLLLPALGDGRLGRLLVLRTAWLRNTETVTWPDGSHLGCI